MSTMSSSSRWAIFAYDRQQAGRGPTLIGFVVLIPILLGFVLWSVLAPLNSAAIATGQIVLSSERKTVQHLEGGLVTGIYVQEGAYVEKGAPLLAVQDLAEQSRKQALEVQLVNLNAQIARLSAEQNGADEPDFSRIATGLEAASEVKNGVVSLNQAVFVSLQGSQASAASLAQSRKMQIAREIEGLSSQLIAKTQEEALVKRDIATKETLYQRGLVTDLEMNALLRSEAVLAGEVGALRASIARLEQSAIDQDYEIHRLKTDRASVRLGELQQAQIAAENIRQELRTINDIQDRAIIRAPASGLVLGMQVHTNGAVISPGVPLMEIVPQDDDLIVEARVKPIDIDLVSAGMRAEVMLSAFKAQKVSKLPASVQTISGDIVVDEFSGEQYFLARLVVDQKALSDLPKTVDLYPGMPAEVFLIAGERTFADYFVSPITDAALRAFRED